MGGGSGWGLPASSRQGNPLPPGGNGKSLDEGHFLALQEDKLL